MERQISLFLQYRVQLPNGTLVLDASGKLPVGTETPGIIRYLGSGGERERERAMGRLKRRDGGRKRDRWLESLRFGLPAKYVLAMVAYFALVPHPVPPPRPSIPLPSSGGNTALIKPNPVNLWRGTADVGRQTRTRPWCHFR